MLEQFLNLLDELLEKNQPYNKHGIWSNGEEIMCKTKEQAEAIADLLEDCGMDCTLTGYYDPKEDARNNEVDEYTGYYYVSMY